MEVLTHSYVGVNFSEPESALLWLCVCEPTWLSEGKLASEALREERLCLELVEKSRSPVPIGCLPRAFSLKFRACACTGRLSDASTSSSAIHVSNDFERTIHNLSLTVVASSVFLLGHCILIVGESKRPILGRITQPPRGDRITTRVFKRTTA